MNPSLKKKKTKARIVSEKAAGFTALMAAAARGHANGVVFYLTCEDDEHSAWILQTSRIVNLQDAAGHTALMWAAMNGHANVVKLLLDDPNVDSSLVNEEGCTARMLAARGVEKLFRKTATLVPHGSSKTAKLKSPSKFAGRRR